MAASRRRRAATGHCRRWSAPIISPRLSAPRARASRATGRISNSSSTTMSNRSAAPARAASPIWRWRAGCWNPTRSTVISSIAPRPRWSIAPRQISTGFRRKLFRIGLAMMSGGGEWGPRPAEPFFEAKAKVYDKAEKKINELRVLRETDPARAVDEFEEVRVAAEAAQAAPDDPEALQNLARARLDAQGKVGIPDGLRTPITKAEAKVLAAPLRGVEGEYMEKAATDWFAGLQQRYGPYGRAGAEASIEYALTRDKDLAKMVTGQIESITQGLQPSAASIRRTEYLMEANRAVGAYGGFCVGEPMRQYGAGARTTSQPLADDSTPGQIYMNPKGGAQIGDRFIPQGAIDHLLQNPALADRFNEKFGMGVAETILSGTNPDG